MSTDSNGVQRMWDGGPVEGPGDFYLLEWTDELRVRHAWCGQSLEMVLAKRAGVLGQEPRVLHVQAYSRKAVADAWEAGAFEGLDRDMNYGTREGHAKGIDNFSSVPV